ncbi:CobW family GTP-binding protein [Gloeobacter morelensis]|uniref:GTP-binding protein n=1 Tax=Gloeobacter morelensis MG652769 TaxID=2781736 RepID=A0ABY3PQP8_9CYAN|nr:GTP-binding protein [Gloeobacter morelensis]UFP95935.1 GTP-binding protein [Gloeobacter morelensis MG652769]
MQIQERGLPVTVITGFLGSGKTTLVNHILRNNQGIKTAVIVNEFGDIGIDSELIVSTEEDMVELENGCICCTVRDDLVQATLRILERDHKVDYLVVETTGLADPLPVAMTFLGPELRNVTRLDGIIGVVDAENFAPTLFNSETAANQIAYSDIILLNKTDCVEHEALERLEGQIRELKEDGPILRTEYGRVDLRMILDVGVFKLEEQFAEAETEEHGHVHGPDCGHDHDEHDHGHSHDHHEHDHDHHHHNHIEAEGFTSISLVSERPLAAKQFEQFLKDLPEGVFRGKGILWLAESPEKVIFHLVGSRIRIDRETWDGARKNQAVFIGKDFDREALKARWSACLA